MEVGTDMKNTIMPLKNKRRTGAVAINSFPSIIMSHYSLQQWSKAFALLFGIFFIICLLWNYVITDPALQRLHMDILRLSLPGFSDMSPVSILIGLIESVLYGLILGAATASSLNIFAKK